MNENWSVVDKKLIINRTLLLAFSSIGVIFWFFISFFHYESSHDFLVEIMYFTIWSNIFVFIWAIFGFAAIISKQNFLENKINHWFWKGIPFIWITITFFVFNFYLLPRKIIHNNLNFKESILYIFGISIVHHFIVPLLMVNDYRITGINGNNKEENGLWSKKEIVKNTSYSVIIPLIWLILSLILISQNIIDPQYPFMDLFGVSSNVLAVNIIILILISIAYLFFTISLFLFSNKKTKKSNNYY